MRMRGLEPPRPERHTDLNRARLPIPPHPRADDSSRHSTYWHAARKPPGPNGVPPIMIRIFALLCAVPGLRLCPPPAEPPRSASRGPSTEVDRHACLASARRQDGNRPPGARSRPIDREQARFAAALHESIPQARIRWRYRLVLNGAAVVRPAVARYPGSVRFPASAAVESGSPTRVGVGDATERRRLPRERGRRGSPNRGRRVKIGIIDDGVDQSHPYFSPTGYTMPAGLPQGPGRRTRPPR